MATNTGTTALSTAMKGGKVSEKQAQSALGSAVSKIANLTKKAESSKEAMMETGTLVLHTAETQGSLFLASMAEGFFGEEKLKIGAVDVRAPVGLLAQGYGLYQTISGQKGAGAHVLSLGNGVMGSWLATVARNAGRTLAEKRGGGAAQPAAAPASAPAPMVVMQGAPMLPAPSLFPEPGLAGPTREVLLTPEATEGDELGRRGGMRRRMRRRMHDQELDDDEALEGDDDLAGDDELGRRGGRGGRRRRMRRRIRNRMQQRQQEQEPEDDEALDGDDFGRRGRRRGRFVRADDDDTE